MAVTVNRDWVSAQLDDNLHIVNTSSIYVKGSNTEIGIALGDETQPIINEYTGYKSPVVNLKIPFLFTKEVGGDSDLYGRPDSREVRDFRLSHSMAQKALQNAMTHFLIEEKKAYLDSITHGKVTPIDVPKTHTEAVADRIRSRVDALKFTDLYDEMATGLQVVMAYFRLGQRARCGSNIHTQVQKRGIELFESLFEFGYGYKNPRKLENYSNGHKKDEIEGVIECHLLSQIESLRTLASFVQAAREKDISFAEPTPPDLYKWAGLAGRWDQNILDVVKTAWAKDAKEHFGKLPEEMKEELKQLLIG